MSTPMISIHQLYQALSSIGSNDLILDVRSAAEYQSGHVPGSKNIPYDEVLKHVDELKRYEHIYIYCQAGRRAGIAASALEQAGLKNLICASGGGMGDWIPAGYPIQK